MKDEQRAEIERLLAEKGVDASVIEQEGWPPLDMLGETEATAVQDWLNEATAQEMQPKPGTPAEDVKKPDERRSVIPKDDVAKGGELQVGERKYGVWMIQAFFDPAAMRLRVYAKRYNGGPENEWTNSEEIGSLGLAKERAPGAIDVMLSAIRARP